MPPIMTPPIPKETLAPWLVLLQMKNKRGSLMPVRPVGVEHTSRLVSSDPVANGLNYGPHCGKNNMMKSWTVPSLSLKAKIEPGIRGSQVMIGDWQEATPSSRGF
jgi:hypothetical protein